MNEMFTAIFEARVTVPTVLILFMGMLAVLAVKGSGGK